MNHEMKIMWLVEEDAKLLVFCIPCDGAIAAYLEMYFLNNYLFEWCVTNNNDKDNRRPRLSYISFIEVLCRELGLEQGKINFFAPKEFDAKVSRRLLTGNSNNTNTVEVCEDPASSDTQAATRINRTLNRRNRNRKCSRK